MGEDEKIKVSLRLTALDLVFISECQIIKRV